MAGGVQLLAARAEHAHRALPGLVVETHREYPAGAAPHPGTHPEVLVLEFVEQQPLAPGGQQEAGVDQTVEVLRVGFQGTEGGVGEGVELRGG